MTPKKEKKDLLPVGRKTKYKEEYIQMMLDYFETDIPNKVLVKSVESENEDGEIEAIESYKIRGNKLPFLSAFARSINVERLSLRRWAEQKDKEGNLKHPEFSSTYKECKKIQKERLISGGLSGEYNATAFIFTAKNITNMRDKVEVDNNHKFGAITDDDLDEMIIEKVMKIIK